MVKTLANVNVKKGVFVNTIPVKEIETPRVLTFNIFRYNPLDKQSEPHMDSFTVEEADTMTLFIALNEIRDNQDPSLQFDFVCRAGICGSSGMLINGKPKLACRVLTKDLPNVINLAPLPGFELIGDLSVDTGKWMRGMSERLQTWVHTKQGDVDIQTIEQPMDPELAEKLYELERCVECGCCIAACGTAQMKPEFIGAIGINQLARFRMDPRDERTNAEFYAVLGDENGVYGCMTMLACDDLCPKELPLAQQIAYMRRQMSLN